MFVLRWALSKLRLHAILCFAVCMVRHGGGGKGYFPGTVDRLRYFLVPLQALCGRRGCTRIIQH